MNHDEYLSYISEIKMLETLLAEIPEDNVLERISFEDRLAAAKSAIVNITESKLTYKVRLTFQGKPVLGSHAIVADFGSKAASADNLQEKGPIPDKQKNQLLITETAIGSFGFEFELPEPEEETPINGSTSVEKALKLVQELLQRAVEGTDDDIAELIDEIHPRAFKKTAEFLNYVAQHDSWCSLDFKNRSFRFQNLKQLEIASKRLQENNIHEKTETYQGEFQGVLPTNRVFEFRPADQPIIIKGKIGQSIKDPDLLNRNYLHKHVKVEIDITQVGTGKPRYTLSSLNKIHFLP